MIPPRQSRGLYAPNTSSARIVRFRVRGPDHLRLRPENRSVFQQKFVVAQSKKDFFGDSFPTWPSTAIAVKCSHGPTIFRPSGRSQPFPRLGPGGGPRKFRWTPMSGKQFIRAEGMGDVRASWSYAQRSTKSKAHFSCWPRRNKFAPQSKEHFRPLINGLRICVQLERTLCVGDASVL